MDVRVLAALGKACESAFGAPAQVHSAALLTGGASAETWRFDCESAGISYPCILRRSSASEEGRFGVALSKAQEADCLERVSAFGVPVPRVHCRLDPLFGDGYVMARCEGEALARRILRDSTFALARACLPSQCASALARLHAAPRDSFPSIPSLDAATQWRELEKLYRDFGLPSAVFELAFRWLAEHLPAPTPLVWVHGDFRLGNLLVDADGLVAVLDWELSHLGDPVEDLGWFCVRSWRFGADGEAGGLCSRDVWRQAYMQASGVEVEASRLHFWEMFGTLKWGVICLFQVSRFLNRLPHALELAAIGRRVSEVEHDLLLLLEAA